MATHLQRVHMQGLMRWLIANEKKIGYLQKRPMGTYPFREQNLAQQLEHGTIAMDCSESVTLICRLAGLSDPNGLAYNGYGFTGTMLGHLPHYEDPHKAALGALVVFGPGQGDHVCMVLKPGADPLLFSHGQEKGPVAVLLSEERKFQQAPVTFLDVSHL